MAQRSAATSAAGYGFARSRNGAANMHAVTCLPAVTGAWQHEGGGALWSNRGMYHWNKTLIEGLDARRYRRSASLDMSRVGSVLTGDRNELRRRAAGPRDADPESESADRLSRFQPRPPRLLAATTCSSPPTNNSSPKPRAGPMSCCRRRCSWSMTTCIRPAATATSRSAPN